MTISATDKSKPITEISVEGGGLTGISFNTLSDEEKVAITKLTVNTPNIGFSKLDLSPLIGLTELEINGTGLTNLDTSTLTNLTNLTVKDNTNLANLTLGDITGIAHLTVTGTRLTNLDASKLTSLEVLTCNDNQLENLTMPDSAGLRYVNISHNKLGADAQKALFAALPINSSQGNLVLINEDGSEQNKTDFTNGSQEQKQYYARLRYAQAKNWNIYNGTNPLNKPEHYDSFTVKLGNEKSLRTIKFKVKTQKQMVSVVVSVNGSNRASTSYDADQYIVGNLQSRDIRPNYRIKFTVEDSDVRISDIYIVGGRDSQKITELDASDCIELESLKVQNNELGKLILPYSVKLNTMYLYHNKLRKVRMEEILKQMEEYNIGYLSSYILAENKPNACVLYSSILQENRPDTNKGAWEEIKKDNANALDNLKSKWLFQYYHRSGSRPGYSPI